MFFTKNQVFVLRGQRCPRILYRKDNIRIVKSVRKRPPRAKRLRISTKIYYIFSEIGRNENFAFGSVHDKAPIAA